jgi:AcrR family transcriptional regulator
MATYHHGDLRAAVLRAAGKQLEKGGIAELSLREVARRAGVSHNAPYRHFPNRGELLATLGTQGFEMLAESVQGKSGREMAEGYVRFALANPQRFRLMFGHPQLREAASASYASLEKAFEGQGIDAGLAAAAAWSLVHGLSHLLLEGHFAARDRNQFIRDVLGIVRFSQRSA